MAERLGYGAGRALSNVGQLLIEQGTREKNRRQQTGEGLLKDYTDKVLRGELDPEQASRALAGMGLPVPPDYFARLEPPVADRVQGMSDTITKATSPGEVPTKASIGQFAKAKRLPVRFGEASADRATNPGLQGIGESGNLPSIQSQPISPEVTGLLEERDQKLDSFAPVRVSEYDPQLRTMVDQFLPSRPDRLTGSRFQTQPTPEQAGENEAIKQLHGEFNPAITGAKIEQQNTIEEGTRSGKVRTASQIASAGEDARLRVQLAPQYVRQRINEAVQRTVEEARARNDVTTQQAIKAKANQAGALMPFLDKMIGLTKQLNTQSFGPTARAQGYAVSGLNLVGLSPTMREIDTEIARNLRPLARVIGVNEANVTDNDIVMVKNAIGIKPGLTTEERVRVLKGLRDVITLGPIVESKLPPDASFQERLMGALQLGQQRSRAEAEAIQAGQTRFKDPVTGITIDVIQ